MQAQNDIPGKSWTKMYGYVAVEGNLASQCSFSTKYTQNQMENKKVTS